MIGNLIKIRQQEADAVAKATKTPFWKKRWFRGTLYTLGGLAVLGPVGLWLYLKPHRVKAYSYDLSIINRMEISTVVHDRKGTELAELAEEARRPIVIDQVPHHFTQALCAAEDGRFYSHGGVDYIGLVRATLLNVKAGRVTQGGSTITQQLARRAFEGVDKSIAVNTMDRKFTEMYLAQRIEKNFSKSEIMELYLNRIYLGSGCHGLGAAALKYFGKEVKDLDVLESATICGLIKRPDKYNPLIDKDAAKRNRDQVLGRMVDEKFLSSMECERLRALPVAISPHYTTKAGSYIVDRVRSEADHILEDLGYDAITGQGLHIYTSIDSELQAKAEASVRTRLKEIEDNIAYQDYLKELAKTKKDKARVRQTYAEYEATLKNRERMLRSRPDLAATTPIPEPTYLQSALTVMDNATGQVLAMVGGRDYSHNKVNLADSKPGRTPGTAFLPFVYATAFENKHFPGTRLNDEPLDNSRIMVGGLVGILGEWGREGQTEVFQRNITARGALVQSMNGASARLGLEVGLPQIRDFARRAGLERVNDLPASILGASEVTVDEMCLGYSTFANGGERPASLHMVQKIVDAAGTIIWKRTAQKSVQVTDPITAYMVTDCLQDAMAVGTGSPAEEFGLKVSPIAGKTGTHYEFRDLFFAGYTSAVTCSVWVGLKDRPETLFPEAYSNKFALPIWVDVMNSAAENYKPQEFVRPERIETVDLCALAGLRSTDRCYGVQESKETGQRVYVRTTYKEFIRPGFKLNQTCDVHKDDITNIATSSKDPEEVPRPPSMLGNTPGSTTSGRNAIPLPLKQKTVLGTDPYNSVEPNMREVQVIPRAAKVGEEANQFRMLETPVLEKPRTDLPEAPAINIE